MHVIIAGKVLISLFIFTGTTYIVPVKVKNYCYWQYFTEEIIKSLENEIASEVRRPEVNHPIVHRVEAYRIDGTVDKAQRKYAQDYLHLAGDVLATTSTAEAKGQSAD